jgi:uncharacterized protein YdaU (DUF1376 family)
MAKPPAFQFYPQDFLVGTANFRPEERGAYISLLCYQWEQGGIEYEDFEQLSGLQFEKLKRVFLKFQKCDDGIYRNSRMEETREKQKNFSERQREKVKKRYQTPTEPLPNAYQTDTLIGNTIKKNEDCSMKTEDKEENKVEVLEGMPEKLKKIPPERAEAQMQFSINKPTHWSDQYMEKEVDAWFDFYSANGWRVGKNKMKDWKATIRTWIRNDYNFKKVENGTPTGTKQHIWTSELDKLKAKFAG